MFSLSQTARLLRIRGNAMQQAVPVGEGAMAAIIGLEADAVEAVCTEAAGEGVCQIANDNGGGQLVISGSKAAVERAAALASEKGAKRAIMLPVSAPVPFRPDGAGGRRACARRSPACGDDARACRSWRTSRPSRSAIPTRSRLLVEQVTGRVRWRETVEWLAANGVTTLYEIGAGKVLTGLARRIDRNLSAIGGRTRRPTSTPRCGALLPDRGIRHSRKERPCLI